MNKKVIGLLLWVLIILAGCSFQTKVNQKPKFESNQLTMYIATDLHYLAPSLIQEGQAFDTYIKTGAARELLYMDELLEAFISEIEVRKPQMLVLSGDLTNNGELESHKALADKLRTIEMMGTEVYVIPGNHDISNPNARGFTSDKQYVVEGVDPNQFAKLYRDFGYGEAISTDKDSLSYLVSPSEKVWLLMLDTTQNKMNMKQGYPEMSGELSDKTLKWVSQCLKLAKEKGATVIPVMHHSLNDHSPVIRDGFTLTNNVELQQLFAKNNVELALSGHVHIQDISSVQVDDHKVFDIATNALSVFPNQFGILSLDFPSRLTYMTKELDVEGWAKQHSTDPYLLNFETYSQAFFDELGTTRPGEQLKLSGVSDEEFHELLEVMKLLNRYYFSGRENEIPPHVKQLPGYLAYEEIGGFLKNYIYSIGDDWNEEDNKLELRR